MMRSNLDRNTVKGITQPMSNLHIIDAGKGQNFLAQQQKMARYWPSPLNTEWCLLCLNTKITFCFTVPCVPLIHTPQSRRPAPRIGGKYMQNMTEERNLATFVLEPWSVGTNYFLKSCRLSEGNASQHVQMR